MKIKHTGAIALAGALALAGCAGSSVKLASGKPVPYQDDFFSADDRAGYYVLVDSTLNAVLKVDTKPVVVEKGRKQEAFVFSKNLTLFGVAITNPTGGAKYDSRYDTHHRITMTGKQYFDCKLRYGSGYHACDSKYAKSWEPKDLKVAVGLQQVSYKFFESETQRMSSWVAIEDPSEDVKHLTFKGVPLITYLEQMRKSERAPAK